MQFIKSLIFDQSFPARENELNQDVDFNRPIAFKIELDGLTLLEYDELRRTPAFERCVVQAMKQTMEYVHNLYQYPVNETGVVIEDTGIIIIEPRLENVQRRTYFKNVMHLSSCISSVFTRALQSVATPFENIIRKSVIITQMMYINDCLDAENYITYVYNNYWDPEADETMPNIYFIKPTEPSLQNGTFQKNVSFFQGPPLQGTLEEGEIREPYTTRDGVYTDWLDMIETYSLECRHAGETDDDNDADYIPEDEDDSSFDTNEEDEE